MDRVCNEKQCFGCAACIEKCPVSCIYFTENKLGHYVAQIDTSRCIDCKSCVKVCPANHQPDKQTPLEVFAAWRRDKTAHLQSSSGGVASALSEYIVKHGGIVYGVRVTAGFNFQHVRCSSLDELRALRGSKYVQSDMRGMYKQIDLDLKNNRNVLFIGTPCQVAGVRNSFSGRDKKLITADLVCHGVPSNAMLRASLPYDIINANADHIDFRENSHYYFSVRKGRTKLFERPLHRDYYLKGFFVGLFLRDSCYTCPYAQTARVGDITLGDFWGVNRAYIPLDSKIGVSLCLINSLKGKTLYENIKSDIETVSRPYEEAIKHNNPLRAPHIRNLKARVFQTLFPIIGFQWSIRLSIPEIIIKGCFFHNHASKADL